MKSKNKKKKLLEKIKLVDEFLAQHNLEVGLPLLELDCLRNNDPISSSSN